MCSYKSWSFKTWFCLSQNWNFKVLLELFTNNTQREKAARGPEERAMQALKYFLPALLEALFFQLKQQQQPQQQQQN